MIEAIEKAKGASRILIVKTSSLGDICKALPVADVIRQARPDSHIGWVVKQPYRTVIDSNPNVDTTFAFPRKDLWAAIKAGLDARKVKYDVALDLQSLFVSALISRLSGAKIRVGYDTKRECSHWLLNYPVISTTDPERIASDVMLDFPKALGITEGAARPQRWLADARRNEAEALMTIVRRPYACIFVGAPVPQRQWSHQRWGTFADRLSEEGITPVFVGAHADQPATVSARSGSQRTTYSIVGRTDLLQLASVFDGAAVVIGSDSDQLHLAAAVGTPVVGLYGPTSPSTAGPTGAKSQAVYLKQHCSPCNRRPTCGGAFFCMAAIEVDNVMRGVREALRNGTSH